MIKDVLLIVTYIIQIIKKIKGMEVQIRSLAGNGTIQLVSEFILIFIGIVNLACIYYYK